MSGILLKDSRRGGNDRSDKSGTIGAINQLKYHNLLLVMGEVE
ncbi:MAG: hypothetical protein AAB301_02285 [Nitrospirota bacterium]